MFENTFETHNIILFSLDQILIKVLVCLIRLKMWKFVNIFVYVLLCYYVWN